MCKAQAHGVTALADTGTGVLMVLQTPIRGWSRGAEGPWEWCCPGCGSSTTSQHSHHHHLPIGKAQTSSKAASELLPGKTEPSPCPSHRHNPPGCTQMCTNLLQPPLSPPPPPSRGHRPFPAAPSASFPTCTAQGAANYHATSPPDLPVEKLRHEGDLCPVGAYAMGTYAFHASLVSHASQGWHLPPPWHSPSASSEPLASQSLPPPSSPSLHARC